MKRATIICIITIILILIWGFSRTAWDPGDFSGEWYSSTDQTLYRFQEGLIYSAKHNIPLSDSHSISGAYAYTKNSVFLFVSGIAGLEGERELFLVKNADGSFLCESKDGTGQIYFIRHNQ